MIKIFVYGTLRKGGEANSLLSRSRLLNQNVRLKGFLLYNFGPYPFAIKTGKIDDFILGDLYEVENFTLKQLDGYEGEMYKRIYTPDLQTFIYVKFDNLPENYPKIPTGNWFFRNADC